MELEDLQTEATAPTQDVERLKQLAAVRFYIQAVINDCEGRWFTGHGGITNYLTLLDDIRHLGNKDVTLVTFNYDRMLDTAAATISGRPIDGMNDYLSLDPFSVFKVHGSVDWGRLVTGHPGVKATDNEPNIAARLINAVAEIEITDEFRRVNITGPIPIVRIPPSEVLFPGVAIPVQTKQRFECPKSHLDALEGRLNSLRRILIVGWRGMDRHFSDLLQKHLHPDVRIQVVCGGADQSREVQTNLESSGVRANFEILDSSFSSYILEKAGWAFLQT